MSVNLKPCPFCGRSDIGWQDVSDCTVDRTEVYCRDCGSSVEGVGSRATALAIDLWNTRAPVRVKLPAFMFNRQFEFLWTAEDIFDLFKKAGFEVEPNDD